MYKNCKLLSANTVHTLPHSSEKLSLLHSSQVDGNTAHHRPFFSHHPLLPHTNTQKFMSYSMKFGTVWLHYNITNWTAFSLDFPVAQ